MDHSEAHLYLNSFNNFESQLHKLRSEDFNLNRIWRFLDLLGNPTKELKIIHVAGTKGKGSTCAFLASILQVAGYKVGLYTSPHLHKVNERIRILDSANASAKGDFPGSISDEELSVVLNSLRPHANMIRNEGNILTYFEVLTVTALCYFAKNKVDVVILETGLGGRLDATNAVDSSVAVITPVSLDHTRILGTALKQIAFEKAGIIKDSHQKVVIAPQEKEALDVIQNRCREFGVEPILVDPDKYKKLEIGLHGSHQKINAACALEVLTVLMSMGFKISEEAIKQGLKNVYWPGRFERIKKDPDIIVDGAHNGASAQALAQTLISEYPQRRIILILGISEDKDAATICKPLKEISASIILTKAQHPRSHEFTQSEGRTYFGNLPLEITGSVAQAIEKALKLAKPQDIIVVTGSIFMVAEARRI